MNQSFESIFFIAIWKYFAFYHPHAIDFKVTMVYVLQVLVETITTDI